MEDGWRLSVAGRFFELLSFEADDVTLDGSLKGTGQPDKTRTDTYEVLLIGGMDRAYFQLAGDFVIRGKSKQTHQYVGNFERRG